MAPSSRNENTSSTTASAIAPGVVVFLQAHDDEVGRNLGLERQVAGDENDRAVFADGPRERQREAGEHRREERSGR